MRKRGLWMVVMGALMAAGVHGHVWNVYHLARAFGF